MSSPLAIAAVTALLKDLLDNAVIDEPLTSSVGNVVVTAKAPDLIKVEDEITQLNLFMYHVTPNQGWRNQGLPSRNGHGDRISNPPLALDLHYMLTAYASKDFHAEILLGYAMQILHEFPVLTRAAINRSFRVDANVDSTSELPTRLRTLRRADLADQMELVKITPEIMSIEEMSKLWAAIQGHYRPTAAYKASVVLIENAAATRAPLPVLTRGALDRGAEVRGSLVPPFPAIESITVRNPGPPTHLGPPYRAAIPGETIDIVGHDLDGTALDVRFTSPRLTAPILLSAAGSATTVSVALPVGDNAWAPGLYSVAVIVRRTGETFDRTTDELPLLLAPVMTLPPDSVVRAADLVTITLKCAPHVRPDQRVALVLGDLEIPAESRTAVTDTVVFKSKNLPAGTYKARLRVDGVDSRLVDQSKKLPEFFSSQTLTVP